MRTFKRYHGENYWYFVTSVTEKRVWHFASSELAQLVADTLRFYAERGDYELHAYVVMPDHLHAVITPIRGTISDAMRNVKSWVAKEFRDRTGYLDSSGRRVFTTR